MMCSPPSSTFTFPCSSSSLFKQLRELFAFFLEGEVVGVDAFLDELVIRHDVEVAAKHDVGAAARHVGGDGHGLEAARLRDDGPLPAHAAWR